MLTQFIRDTFAGMPTAVRGIAMLAGGALRAQFDGTAVNARDLFFRNEADFAVAYSAFKVSPDFVIDQCDSAERYPAFKRIDDGRVYQLIGLYFHETPMLLAQSFDFRCCAMVAWVEGVDTACSVCDSDCEEPCERLHIYLEPGSTQDAELLRLTPQVRQSDERITKRVNRYKARGYRKCEGFNDILYRLPLVQSGY